MRICQDTTFRNTGKLVLQVDLPNTAVSDLLSSALLSALSSTGVSAEGLVDELLDSESIAW